MKIKALLLLLAAAFSLASCTKRKPEEIDYAPNLPCNPSPADSSGNINHTTLDVTLSWSAYDRNTEDVLTYEVYFDTLNPPLTSIASGLSSPSVFVDSLSYNTTYYWKVFATDQAGTTTASIVWRFTTLPHANSAPNAPSYLYPTNNASWQYPTLYFALNGTDPQGSSDTLYYDLYLGITPQPPITRFKNDPANSWEFTGLNYATTYYWKAVARDNHYAYTPGPVFSFITRDSPWFYKREMPSPRYGFGTAVVNGKIYVIGGNEGLADLAEVLEYNPVLNTWTRKADMPTARSELAVAVWDNLIYAMGGRTHSGFYNANEVYDPLLNVWNTLSPVPGYMSGTSAHAINGRIYTLDSIMEYNISTDDWWDTTRYEGYPDTITLDSIVWRTDTINTPVKSSPPNSKGNSCSAVYNNLIYVIGGLNNFTFSPFVDVYHPETNAWTTASNMIFPASFSAAVTANGSIYVLGGYDGTYSRKVRKYDPLSDSWHIRSDMLTGRSFLGAAFISNRIYAIGGLYAIPVSTIEEYQLDLDPKTAKR